MGTKTPTGVCVHSQRCVSTHALPAMHTCGPHICTRRPWPGAQAHRVTRHHTGAPGAGRWAARMPSSRPHSPTPSSWPFFCNSCIYFTVLYIGRGFQNTLGLFTEPCRNTLSPFQLSLPERSRTCPSLVGPAVCSARSRPPLLKGPARLPLWVGWCALGPGSADSPSPRRGCWPPTLGPW